MSVVLRLNILITTIFMVVMLVCLATLMQLASRDIARETGASIRFANQLFNLIELQPQNLDAILNQPVRHVRFELTSDISFQPKLLSEQFLSEHSLSEHSLSDQVGRGVLSVPQWFTGLIPGIAMMQRQYQRRFLEDGRLLIIQAYPIDEVTELWETCLLVAHIFLLTALLSNVAIWWGVKLGLRPVAQLLEALDAIGEGQLAARLPGFRLAELNQLARHFNSMALSLQQQREDNSFLSRSLMTLQEQERVRLARELHDDLGQYVTGIRAQAFIVASAPPDPAISQQAGERITQHCDEMHRSFRRLINTLHPLVLDHLPLPGAITHLAEQWQQQFGIKCRVTIDACWTGLDETESNHIYRFTQEALTNIARHAAATGVEITVKACSGDISLTVSDNGCGLAGQQSGGLGLRSMKERAAALGGRFCIMSEPGEGTAVRLIISQSAALQAEEVVDENTYC